MNIKQRIQSLIDNTATTKNMLALEQQLHFANGTISHWDKHFPAAKNVLKVADYFDCSVDFLYGRTDNPSLNRQLLELDHSNYELDDLLNLYKDRYHLSVPQRKSVKNTVLAYLTVYARVDELTD